MWDREVVRGERYGSKKTCDDERYCDGGGVANVRVTGLGLVGSDIQDVILLEIEVNERVGK